MLNGFETSMHDFEQEATEETETLRITLCYLCCLLFSDLQNVKTAD